MLVGFFQIPVMFETQLNKYTVAKLKEELSARKLDTAGKKADLVQKLNTYLEGNNYMVFTFSPYRLNRLIHILCQAKVNQVTPNTRKFRCFMMFGLS